MKSKNILPPAWLLIAMLTMLGLHFLFPVMSIVPRFWNLSGLVLIVLGFAMNLVADGAFKQARTTVEPFQESSALVMDGLFRISRNPMYLGFVLILTGIAILLRSLSPYLIIFAFVFLIDRAYIRVEERMLAEKFGAVWEAYKTRTRRWL